MEQSFSAGRRGPELRPFCESAAVACRECSQPLQRASIDFAADVPFARATAKLKEHYGIEVGPSVIRALTEKHGAAILVSQESQKPASELPERPGVPELIGELDGSMVPIVETAAPGTLDSAGEAVDRRKTRVLFWKESRLSLVRKPGDVEPILDATMGSVEQAGKQLLGAALRAGAGSKTKFHCLGDGAPWINEQVELQFGAQANYLIDFYHLCEYLAAAGQKIAGTDKAAWLEEKKSWLKENRWPEVLDSLRPFLENEAVPDPDAPVRACYRYIKNRPKFLDYKSALEAGLPIGSGEVESAHRYLIQERLKVSGGWWKLDNAEKMLALRALRANGDWERYWSGRGLKAA